METNIILQGDALLELKKLPDESIDCVMTSPPYWALRDYGTANWEGGDINCDHKIPDNEQDPKNKNAGSHISRFNKTHCYKCGAKRIDLQLGLEQTFQEYITKLCDIFDEVKRVLKKTGTCFVNLGDTYGGTGDKGEYRDPKYIKGRNGQVKAVNRTATEKSLCQIPSRFAIEMCNRGWILRNRIIWHKNNCMPSSASDRFTVDYEDLFFFTKNKKYYFEQQFESHLTQENRPDVIVRNREYGYNSKLNAMNKKEYIIRQKHGGTKNPDFYNPNGRNKRTVWNINTKPFSEAHFAVFPEALCVIPIKAGCPNNGIILDPFFGSGTVGVVALKQDKKFIGVELNPEYIKIAEKRLKPFLEQRKLSGF